MRTLIADDPYNAAAGARAASNGAGAWPTRWIRHPQAPATPFVAAFRRRFAVERETLARLHVSADERYTLFLDGVRVGRGPERGDRANWFFETYDLPLAQGEHILVAQVWALGALAPVAQMSVAPGFLCSPQEAPLIELLGTGVAEWDALLLDAYTFAAPFEAYKYFAFGATTTLDAARFPWGFERGAGDGWLRAAPFEAAASHLNVFGEPPLHRLRPATLPPMLDAPRAAGVARYVAALDADAVNGAPTADETQPLAPVRLADDLAAERRAWNALLRGQGSVSIPPGTARRVIIDLDDYVCAYPELVVSGGAGGALRLNWAESLFLGPETREKGNRDEIEGKIFAGLGDVWLLDGGGERALTTLWWRCGRYLELRLRTGDEALTIERLGLRETRYPMEPEATFAASDARLARIAPLATRAWQMCAHETYMDCPYYEQLMYAGDTRVEALLTYALTHDDRLPRKALRCFDASRVPSGLTQSRYPSHEAQIIPPFSLWWVAMVHDYALWRGDLLFVRSLLPGVRSVLAAFDAYRGADGLLAAPDGWNFVDWVDGWNAGIPPDGESGVSACVNWQYVLTLGLAARLADWLDEPEYAARDRRVAARLARRLTERFWDEERGLFADDLAHSRYSEHAQCLAVLSGQLDATLDATQRARLEQGLLGDGDLARASYYFAHYLFETYAALGRVDALLDRLGAWDHLVSDGLKTTIEHPEPTRSDCHAWAAHPLLHYFTSILGVRPTSPGGATVEVVPQLGGLTEAQGRLVHPRGEIAVALQVVAGRVEGEIRLPEGVSGVFRLGATRQPLRAGTQRVGDA